MYLLRSLSRTGCDHMEADRSVTNAIVEHDDIIRFYLLIQGSNFRKNMYIVYNASYWRYQPPEGPKICGDQLPAPMLASSAHMIVTFYTHGLNAGQGFSLSYTTDEESLCGGILQPPSGVISTPNFTVEEHNFVDCKWRIDAEDFKNQTLVYRFDVVDVPGVMANYCRNGVMYVIAGRLFMGRFCGNYTTQVVVTTPIVDSYVRLVSSLAIPMRGISGTYNVSDCGGSVSGVDAQITSPGYPNSYAPNTICHWLISVPPGETMTLTVEDLRMEENCEKDFLTIRNGYHMTSPLLGKFCGTHVPAPITTSGNFLTVIFQTDAYGTAPGFKLTTREVQRGCGGLIHMNKGNITSPNRPSRYDNNVECRWIIEYIPGFLVKLEFTGRFDIEMDSVCAKDYLLVEEYNEDETWSETLRKCGPSNPEPYLSKNRKIRITFHSNDNINGEGFNIAFSAVCGGNFTSLQGEIFSPNYPESYDNSLNCEYTIGKPGQYVSLSFDNLFSIESKEDCIYDSLEIYHNNVSSETLQGPYCGAVAPEPRTLLAPVTLKFSYFDLEMDYRCFEEFLEIRDGLDNGPLIGKICGNSSILVKSTGNVLTLKLDTISLRPKKGFTAFYHMTYGRFIGYSLNGCSPLIMVLTNCQKLPKNFRDHTGSGLGLPFSNIAEQHCVYDVEMKEDVFSEKGLVGRYCGSVLPTAVTTAGNKLYIIFHTDGKNNRAGFKLRFNSIPSPCGPSSLLSGVEPQSVTTPSYPQPYPINLRCKWTVYTNSIERWGYNMVQITIKDLDVPCGGDYVEIRKLKVRYRYRSRYSPEVSVKSKVIFLKPLNIMQ
ncbi:cubilin [Nephila pilipes]|uniref:Cubilin n=1 Tax=Nephila pilipes TaxID=299642 RepID=A0A8X6NJ41_NEPPI|nr:cubilin [Nephila pilipes]